MANFPLFPSQKSPHRTIFSTRIIAHSVRHFHARVKFQLSSWNTLFPNRRPLKILKSCVSAGAKSTVGRTQARHAPKQRQKTRVHLKNEQWNVPSRMWRKWLGRWREEVKELVRNFERIGVIFGLLMVEWVCMMNEGRRKDGRKKGWNLPSRRSLTEWWEFFFLFFIYTFLFHFLNTFICAFIISSL